MLLQQSESLVVALMKFRECLLLGQKLRDDFAVVTRGNRPIEQLDETVVGGIFEAVVGPCHLETLGGREIAAESMFQLFDVFASSVICKFRAQ
jgi:hypothetical protein